MRASARSPRTRRTPRASRAGGRDLRADRSDGHRAGRVVGGDRQGHQGDHVDRAADQPARPQRDHRGRARRRGGQGLRGRRQRGQGTGQGDREGDRGHQPARSRRSRATPAASVEAIASISEVIGQITDIQNTIASAVEEQTATTNGDRPQRHRGGPRQLGDRGEHLEPGRGRSLDRRWCHADPGVGGRARHDGGRPSGRGLELQVLRFHVPRRATSPVSHRRHAGASGPPDARTGVVASGRGVEVAVWR